MTVTTICRLTGLGLALHLACASMPAAAQDATSQGAGPVDETILGFFDEIWQRDSLSGGWGGLRDGLAQSGFLLAADTIDEVLGNSSGGVRTGAVYEGRFEILATVDLEKVLGWTGATLHANAYQIHGRGLSANDLGNNLLVASTIEADRSTRLFDVWVEQLLNDGNLSVRAGQIAVDDEFFVSDGASNFINATFGWPAIMSQALPSGGAAYPLATPGLRVNVATSGKFSVMAAIVDGNPAGPGTGDPQLRDPSGTAFRLHDGAFIISEANYKSSFNSSAGDLASSYKLGAWFHSGDFADQRWDASGQSLAAPTSSGIAAIRHHDYGAYFIVDQVIWHVPDTQDHGLSAFLRGSWAPDDRNEIALYCDAGLAYKALFPDRPDDVTGIAFALAGIGGQARALDRDYRALDGIGKPVRDHEAVVEITHHFQVTQWWTLAPDFQFVIHPDGNVPLPHQATGGPLRPIPDATIVGLRSAIVF
ncbi:MAG: carbohydrate porin [Rhizomicrobium sp.]